MRLTREFKGLTTLELPRHRGLRHRLPGPLRSVQDAGEAGDARLLLAGPWSGLRQARHWRARWLAAFLALAGLTVLWLALEFLVTRS